MPTHDQPITITSDTGNTPPSPDPDILNAERAHVRLVELFPEPPPPAVRHVAAIVAESRLVIQRLARRRVEQLDLQRTLARLPDAHPRVRPAQARLDLITAALESDTRLLDLLSQELRYASAF